VPQKQTSKKPPSKQRQFPTKKMPKTDVIMAAFYQTFKRLTQIIMKLFQRIRQTSHKVRQDITRKERGQHSL
jgi:hypothetical protein